MANDDDFALAMLEQQQNTTDIAPSGPRVSQWSPVREDLAALNDKLAAIYCAILASNGQKAPSPAAHPRPVTAAARVQTRRRRERHEALVARFKRKEVPDG